MSHEPRSGFNPVSIIFLKIFVMGLAGIPFAVLFDRAGFERDFTNKLHDGRFVGIAFAYILYAVLMMALCYYRLGFKKKLLSYIHGPMTSLSRTRLYWLWVITFFLSTICFIYVFIQLGGHHPALQAFGSDFLGIKVLRREVGQAINVNVFNLGFKFFLPLNLILALFFLRKRHALFFLSIVLFLIMSTLLLEKGQIISAIFLIVFFRMLMSPIALKNFAIYILIGLILLSSMYFLTKFASNLSELGSNMANRVFYGEISDLPVYFELFEQDNVSLASLLPPYIAMVVGAKDAKPAARLAIEHINPKAVSMGTAGAANTFFVGEAYAAAGHLGAAFSPFIVMANLGVFILLFSLFRKGVLTVFIYAWFLYKTLDGVFGGISYFLFSGLHIVLLLLLYVLFSRTFVRRAKRSSLDEPA